MLAYMTTDVHLLSTSLRLHKGQLVEVVPAVKNGYFASPADGSFGDHSILITADDFTERE